MRSQNYYKLTDSLDVQGSGKFYFPELKNESIESYYKFENHKPYLISYSNAKIGLKMILLLAMFSSLFLIGLNAQTIKTVGSIGFNDYSNLKAGFDDVNNGVLTGDIVFHITSNTSETVTATLNETGTGSASYTSILITPFANSLVSISGTVSVGLINLNGASNVTIDGLNTNGDSLVIENLDASAYTIQFTSSAHDNIITNTTILGANTNINSGVINFATASGSLMFGNVNNTINNCEISNASSGNNPVNAINSTGTAGKENQNTIEYCRISEFFSSSTTHAGIKLTLNNSAWSITNNKLFRINEYTIASASVSMYGIYINDGSSYTITNNIIGFATSISTGSYIYNVNNTGHVFYGVYVRATTDQTNTISSNSVANIEINASANSFVFNGLYLEGISNPSIFVVDNNTIGSIYIANSLVLKTTNRLDLYPIRFAGVNAEILSDINDNVIGSINSGAVNLGSLYSSMILIEGNTSSDFSIYDNRIGADGSGKISLGTNTANGDYRINGIGLNHSGSVDLNGNIICHIYENSSGTSSPYVYGINVAFSGGTASTSKVIRNNIIHNLESYSGSSSGSRVAVGIFITSGNNTYTLEVSGNTIYNIKYSGGASVSNAISGIAIPGTTQKMKLFSNSIYGIENNSTYSWSSNTFDREGIYGIEMNNSTNSSNLVEIFNNRIYLTSENNGTSLCIPIKGIDVHSLSTIYYNTVVISGSSCSSGGSTIPTTCLSGGQYLEIPVYNNIFYNNRIGNGKHFAIANDGYTTYTTVNYTFFTDNNIYYTSNSATMAKWGSIDQTFATWTSSVYNGGTGPNVDLSSLNMDPMLAEITDMDLWIAGDPMSPIIGAGVPIPSVLFDFEGTPRSLSTPYVGAYEKIINIWVGNFNNDWNNPLNWYSNVLPNSGENVYFSQTPMNHCVLDGNKIVKSINNQQSMFDLVVNGYELTIQGSLILANGAEIDASVSGSEIIFNNVSEQTIPIGTFVNNEIYNLTINNPSGVSFNNDLSIVNTLEMLSGNINMNSNTIELGTNSGNVGTLLYTEGQIIGGFTRWFSNTTNSGNSGLFPVGYDGNDRFVIVEYTMAPVVGGTLTVNVNSGNMGTNGLPILNISSAGSCAVFDVVTTSDNGYWVIDEGNGLSGGAYDITLIGEGINGINNICELTALKRVGGGNWLESGSHQAVTGNRFRPIVKRTGAIGWSNWGFGGGSLNPLPLNFLSVNANCSSVGNTITWSTTAEENIQNYAVERSIDGKVWETIKFIPANSIFSNINNYSYTDLQVNSSNFYYRVRYIEFNQEEGLSQTVAVDCSVDETIQLNLYPNPTNASVTIKSTEALEIIQVLNAFGNIVFTAYSDEVEFTLDLKDLSSGVYFIKTEYGYSRLMKY